MACSKLGLFLGSLDPPEASLRPQQNGLVSEQLREFDIFDGALERGKTTRCFVPRRSGLFEMSVWRSNLEN